MTTRKTSLPLNRRHLLGAGLALGGLSLAGCASTGSGPSIGRVVIVGGGFGGTTAARYLKLWGGNVDVTLVERNAGFISCPISNLVIGGHKQMADISRSYDGLKALGVKMVQGEVTAIDAAAKSSGDAVDDAYDVLLNECMNGMSECMQCVECVKCMNDCMHE